MLSPEKSKDVYLYLYSAVQPLHYHAHRLHCAFAHTRLRSRAKRRTLLGQITHFILLLRTI
jgi:hypothetical protein